MNVVLISTYDLGHQPFGLASPMAWLREAGASVTCLDLAVQEIDDSIIRDASLIAIHLQMHTATRLAIALLPRLQEINPSAHYCFYGLYAPLNESFLRELGAGTILGGEFESGLCSLYRRLDIAHASETSSHQPEPVISHEKQQFRVPDRSSLPALSSYGYLEIKHGNQLEVGYTEASRGCKHTCRHCPVVPVYDGVFRIVQEDIVLEDIRQQVKAGAKHITFGDPDFFNGAGHAMRIISAFHDEFPTITYDATIKIEHLLQHQAHISELVKTGCLFVTTAVESVDNQILSILEKGHTREDFFEVVRITRDLGLTLSPTFIPFSPWTTTEGYLDLLDVIVQLEMVDYVAPIQLAIRLLLPKGSKLLNHKAIQPHLGSFDEPALSYTWMDSDQLTASLYHKVRDLIQDSEKNSWNRRITFSHILEATQKICDREIGNGSESFYHLPEPTVPRMSEPWYCCAEPTEDQLAKV